MSVAARQREGLRILMVTAEFAPVVKVGGLGDMTAALAAALAARGHDVRVALPLYGDVDREAHAVRPLARLAPVPLRVGQRLRPLRWHRQGSGSSAVKLYLAANDELFGRPGAYVNARGEPFPDALARAVFHAQAALALPVQLDWHPDLVHAHDAQAALAAVCLRRWGGGAPALAAARSLLTIHNLAHQMEAPRDDLDVIGLPREAAVYPGPLEYHGALNVMKAGILEADAVNTVSPTYAREVVEDEEMGCGLGGVLRSRGAAFTGILNGADYATWDPARDRHLPARFSRDRPAGKAACRRELAREAGLGDGPGPLAGFVGRLVEQKGPALLLPLLDDLAAAGLRLVVLATGEERWRRPLAAAAARHPGRIAFRDRFDEALAHRIYAGSDLFLMPSRFEPCGLAQMYALRYGAVPIVRATGGLADTVIDAGRPDGTGFLFRDYTPAALLGAVSRALELWRDPPAWDALRRRGMQSLFPWDEAAGRYEDLARGLLAAGAAPGRGAKGRRAP